MTRLGLAGLLNAMVVPALAGQDGDGRYWLDQRFPFAYYSSIDGFWLAGHVGWYSPVGFAPRPEPSLAAINLDGALSSQGSYLLVADAQAPAWWDGWRAGATITTARENRLGYYGLGNATAFDAAVTDTAGHFYQVSRTRQSLRATIERRVIGPLRVLAGAHIERSDFRPLPGPSVFKQELGLGGVDTASVTDAALRAGVVIDLRDHEIDPHRGAVVEVLWADGKNYRRTTASARVWVQPLERFFLAGRLAVEEMTGTPPLAAQQSMETIERPRLAVGGYWSLRGYYDGRFVGPGKLLGSLEARYAFLWSPTIFELKLVAFYDVGRVFAAGEPVRLTTDGLHSAGG
ncbi:MAG: BamA/TamA family outer membrane protein, partial [Gemmatimonadales bacterium]